MNSIVYPVIAGVNFIAFLYKLRILRRDRSPAQWALCGNFLIAAVIYTASTPAVWVALSASVGVVNFSGIFTQSLAILLAGCQQLVLLHLTYDRDVAWHKAKFRLTGISAVLIVMITLFVFATHASESPTEFAVTTARYYPAYLSIYIAAYLWNQIDVCVLCWRHARVSPRPWLRRGLRIAALTLPAALVYAGCRIADIIAGQFGTTGHAWEPLVPIALLTGTVGKTIGWTLPDWGRYLTAAQERLSRQRAHHELAPLHRQITTHVPEPVLELDSGEDIRTRLYRIVVEIRDAQWALRLWMTPEAASAAHREGEALGLHGDDLLAYVEAQQLKSAVSAKARGAEPVDQAVTPRLAEPQDLVAELAFQRKIARAYLRSPGLPDGAPTPTTNPDSHEGARA
ncbi:MAB_1171c family putative transporter [Streptomyces sp. NPDC090499]|uniref:MAB_1171c family putative transporter n=1 Tax=Streptomyces sp. NPDC090499 TaxID=3365965 RepID=UPI0038246305